MEDTRKTCAEAHLEAAQQPQGVTLLLGDSREILKTLPDASVHACVTDPPYELGFMGKGWDRSGIANDAALWGEVLRVLVPGGHVAAFGGTRTYHRMACAVEDAGFEIRDSLMWLYGTGWPKAKGQLKPGYEPIVLARKPFRGTVARNVGEYGTGALNADACRIGTEPAFADRSGRKSVGGLLNTVEQSRVTSGGPGRWPANVCHDGSDEVLAAFAAFGEKPTGGKKPGRYLRSGKRGGVMGDPVPVVAVNHFEPSEGFADRFFYCAKASTRERTCGGAVANGHPTVKPVSLMAWLCRLLCPPGGVVLDPFLGSGSTGVAAFREEFGFVGIEREVGYLGIAKGRIALAATAGKEKH